MHLGENPKAFVVSTIVFFEKIFFDSLVRSEIMYALKAPPPQI
jgi:hypothetical protein